MRFGLQQVNPWSAENGPGVSHEILNGDRVFLMGMARSKQGVQDDERFLTFFYTFWHFLTRFRGAVLPQPGWEFWPHQVGFFYICWTWQNNVPSLGAMHFLTLFDTEKAIFRWFFFNFWHFLTRFDTENFIFLRNFVFDTGACTNIFWHGVFFDTFWHGKWFYRSYTHSVKK